MNQTLLQNSHQYIWHPCSQMKDYETFKPLIIKKAQGCYITLDNDQKVIDAISSWWCKSLGHGHPRLKEALYKQAEAFEHVIFANTTYDNIVTLSETLTSFMPNMDKVFYAGDGSCAVEIAMKMSIHSRLLEGKPQKTYFMALTNGYHGETTAALSVSDVKMYKKAYQPMLFEPILIHDLPYVTGVDDPLWHHAEEAWLKVKPQLEKHAKITSALILEPIVQGAGGMLIYSADFLKRLALWAKDNDIHLIADEIMTGIGRTGKLFACQYAQISPDFLCLSKGLTSGFLPFSCVMTTNEIYNLFYDDYQKGKAFLHSHTFSGNPLGTAIALEVLNIIQEEKILENVNTIGQIMKRYMIEIAEKTGLIHNIRQIGAIIAADLKNHQSSERLGFKLYQIAVKNGLLLRPLGNSIYWLPPLIADQAILDEIKIKTEISLRELESSKH